MHKKAQPGCPCCEEGDCGQLCITIEESGDPNTASDGAFLDGGTLGTATTGTDGKACFDIDGPGDYAFIVSKDGFITERFTVTVAEGDCNGTEIIKPGPPLDPEEPEPGCQDYFIVQCGPCPRPGVTIEFRYYLVSDGVTLAHTDSFVTKWDGRFRACDPEEYTLGVWFLKVFVPGDGGPQADTPDADSFTEVHFVTGNFITAYQADAVPFWFCFPGEPNRCMVHFPATITVTVNGTAEPLGTHEMTMIVNNGLSADYQSTERHYTSGGTEWDVFVTLPRVLGFGVPCGTKPTADLNASVFLYAAHGDPLPSSATQYTPDTAYPTKACPINFRFHRVIGGVAFPALNMVFTP